MINKIWIDLDNSPHVPFFRPIMEELEKRGYSIVLTARDCFQVCGLADLMDLKYRRIGRHYGKNMFLKAAGLIWRAIQLLPTGLSEKPILAISHGSRAQLLAATILRLPSISIDDYEYSREVADPTWMIMPELIPEASVKAARDRVFRYPGIKEDVYVPFFQPDPSLMGTLKFDPTDLVVTIRPPATEAHYHNPLSEKLFEASINYVGSKERTRIIVLPRGDNQRDIIGEKWGEWVSNRKIIVPNEVVDGLSLIWYSDLVISGGGTMNREAAALGVPVYSIFRGKIGAVDQYLCSTGRLTLLESVEDVQNKISLVRRKKPEAPRNAHSAALNRIVEIIDILGKSKNVSCK
jgi:predicted glycosyltransferase